ncbi:hypothetical protein LINPERHAP1_LOCUS20220 [Linum perenne]
MEKAVAKVGSLSISSSWISKKAKEELSNITGDFTVNSIVSSAGSFYSFCFLIQNLWSLLFLTWVLKKTRKH